MIVGLSGRKRCGKDSLASFLVSEHGFARVAFADPLKDVLLHLDPDVVGVNRQKASLQGLHDIYDGWEGLKEQTNWAPEIRRLQQNLGVAVRDHVASDTWLNAALERVRVLRESDVPVVITDMRFPNEVEGIRQMGGLIVRVERDSIPVESLADTHVSEALLDDMTLLRPDLVINSDPFGTFGERFISEAGLGAHA